MEWYYILFVVTFAILFIKALISFVAGDIDVDFDLDGDIDFDISSLLSFKGIIHFLCGFSGYLSILAKCNNYYEVNEFPWYHYGLAIVIGGIFMIGLWYLYKAMMKFNHASFDNPDFTGHDCNILANLGNGKYEVLIKTESGTFKKTLNHMNKKNDIKVGSTLRIVKDLVNNVYVII